MERRSPPMHITVCDPMADAIGGEFRLTEKGDEEIKGFGTRTLYSLDATMSGHFD
ncbi:hypothetical protein [Magnetospira sp. QH-2]|uniref:hypothetical protein n=1 Tax=Magnetospira sp. (strain QH-2) TaxID=1288970 RepID=UPI00130EFDBE|nr:hypothetical protein [Magnetospira sp. QH-2]